MKRENSTWARADFAMKVERQIAILEMFKGNLRSEIDLPDCLSDLQDKLEEGLAELYSVKAEIRKEIQDLDFEVPEFEHEGEKCVVVPFLSPVS